MANQTITVSKSGAGWTTATQANTAIEGVIGADNKAWYSNTKGGDDLVSFAITLADSDTLVYTREWSDAGWASLSARKDDADATKVALEGAGYTVTLIQPDYV